MGGFVIWPIRISMGLWELHNVDTVGEWNLKRSRGWFLKIYQTVKGSFVIETEKLRRKWGTRDPPGYDQAISLSLSKTRNFLARISHDSLHFLSKLSRSFFQICSEISLQELNGCDPLRLGMWKWRLRVVTEMELTRAIWRWIGWSPSVPPPSLPLSSPSLPQRRPLLLGSAATAPALSVEQRTMLEVSSLYLLKWVCCGWYWVVGVEECELVF